MYMNIHEYIEASAGTQEKLAAESMLSTVLYWIDGNTADRALAGGIDLLLGKIWCWRRIATF